VPSDSYIGGPGMTVADPLHGHLPAAAASVEPGQIFSWGLAVHGQLGLPAESRLPRLGLPGLPGQPNLRGTEDYVGSPVHVGACEQPLSQIQARQAACGHFHSVVLDSHGAVFTFGRDHRGQLGHPDELCRGKGNPVPQLVRELADVVITHVACGAFHCLALASTGQAFSWGCNRRGQLGRAPDARSDACPKPVVAVHGAAAGASFCQLAAGQGHSLAVLSTAQVAVWGSNEMGQLGLGPMGRVREAAAEPIVIGAANGAQVAAGDHHSLLLTKYGEVLATGDASHGCLGISTEDSSSSYTVWFTHVDGLSWSKDGEVERIASIAAGGSVSAAVSRCGWLFTWGCGSWGQLGHGDREDRRMPAIVWRLPSAVISVALAQSHALAVCEPVKGAKQPSLWTWGRRRLVPEGLVPEPGVDSEAQPEPVEVPLSSLGDLGASLEAPDCDIALTVACGGCHSLVLCHVPLPESHAPPGLPCPPCCAQRCTVEGPGTSGGPVSESLDFRIETRSEEGELVVAPGLRFLIWATPRPSSQERCRFEVGVPQADAGECALEVLRLEDCADGTYRGSYRILRPGAYLVRMHLLPVEAALEVAGIEGGCDGVGEALSGSPFEVTIRGGRAHAPHCAAQLRRVREAPLRLGQLPGRDGRLKRGKRIEVLPAFELEAGVDAIWDVHVRDAAGHAIGPPPEGFSARILPVELQDQSEPDGEENDAVRWSRRPGRSEFHWRPRVAGRYHLEVCLLGGGRSEEDQHLAGSPYDVLVRPGPVSIQHSEFSMGSDAMPDLWEPRLVGQPPSTEVPLRLILRDVAGNVCSETSEPHRYVQVRVEEISLEDGQSPRTSYKMPERLVEWKVTPWGTSTTRCSSPGLLALTLRALPVLEELAGRQLDPLVLELAVSATYRECRGQLAGSPCRLKVAVPGRDMGPFTAPGQTSERPTVRRLPLGSCPRGSPDLFSAASQPTPEAFRLPSLSGRLSGSSSGRRGVHSAPRSRPALPASLKGSARPLSPLDTSRSRPSSATKRSASTALRQAVQMARNCWDPRPENAEHMAKEQASLASARYTSRSTSLPSLHANERPASASGEQRRPSGRLLPPLRMQAVSNASDLPPAPSMAFGTVRGTSLGTSRTSARRPDTPYVPRRLSLESAVPLGEPLIDPAVGNLRGVARHHSAGQLTAHSARRPSTPARFGGHGRKVPRLMGDVAPVLLEPLAGRLPSTARLPTSRSASSLRHCSGNVVETARSLRRVNWECGTPEPA